MRFILFFLLIGVCGLANGQEKTIYGAVLSAKTGRPIEGVKVIWLEVKMVRKTRELVFTESKVRTKTNEKGEYMLTITTLQENMVRFRKDGYKTIDFDVKQHKRIDLAMEVEE